MLAPGAAATGVAAAIVLPAFHPMHATPRALLDDFHFMRWRVLGKVFAVVGDACQLVALNVVERIGEGHVAREECKSHPLLVNILQRGWRDPFRATLHRRLVSEAVRVQKEVQRICKSITAGD